MRIQTSGAGEREPGCTGDRRHDPVPDPKSPPTPEQEASPTEADRSGVGGANQDGKPGARETPPTPDAHQPPEGSPTASGRPSGGAQRARPAGWSSPRAAGRAPLLTEVVLRAWGTDDPRVVSPLRAENQPGRHQRAKAVERRAKDAGWPVLWMDEQRKAAVAAVRRLEGMDFSHRGQSRRGYRQRAAGLAVPPPGPHDVWDTDDLVSIFDE